MTAMGDVEWKRITSKRLEVIIKHNYVQPVAAIRRLNASYEQEVEGIIQRNRQFLHGRPNSAVVRRVYDLALQKKTALTKELRAKYCPSLSPVIKLSQGKMHDSVARLYAVGMQNQLNAIHRAEDKVMYKKIITPVILPSSVLKASTERLFTQSVERKRRAIQRLSDRYSFVCGSPKSGATMRHPARTLTEREMEEVTTRLFVTKAPYVPKE